MLSKFDYSSIYMFYLHLYIFWATQSQDFVFKLFPLDCFFRFSWKWSTSKKIIFSLKNIPPWKLKKSIAAFSMKMTFKIIIFLCSAKDALLGRSPGHWLLSSKYMKTIFSVSRQYLIESVVKYNYHLLFWRDTVSLACLNKSIFNWKDHQIRLKIENLGCHRNGLADWRKGSILIHHWT